jgi:hypothetical protein
VSRLDDARAALLTSGLKAREDVVRELIRRDFAQPGPAVPEPGDFASATVRVLCPRGHFVADVTVLAVDTWPGITILPHIEHEHAADHSAHGLAYEIPQNWRGDIEQLSTRVRVSCNQPRCNYRGSKKEDMLKVELADAVSAGHCEHRLTS